RAHRLPSTVGWWCAARGRSDSVPPIRPRAMEVKGLPSTSRHAARCVIGMGVSAAFWLCWTLVAGPGVTTDSWGYLALTDALGRFQLAHADRPDRTPGYPMFLLAIRLAANRLGIDALDATAVVQCALLAGATTYLL